MKFRTEKSLHYFFMGLIGALIVLSICFVYLSANGALQKQQVPDELRRAEEAGQKKQLPKFMLETLKSDELETLKP